MDEGTKLLACSCWILGYVTAMTVEKPLYQYTGKSFCNIVDFLNSLAMVQNWWGGSGIAIMRAILIQWPSIILRREKQVAFLLGIASLTATFGSNSLWFIIYTPTYPDFRPICLGRPLDDPLLHYNAPNALSVDEFHLVVSILTFVTCTILILEITLYFSIFKFLIEHDKMVRLVLSESAIRKRKKRNAVDLFGHAMIFAVDSRLLKLCQLKVAAQKN